MSMYQIKEVPLHAPITVQFKQNNLTNVARFHGQHFSCLEGNQSTTYSACL